MLENDIYNLAFGDYNEDTDSIDDKIIGLELGADDYMTKPFHLSELNARIKALIRRKNFDGHNEIIFNELKINPDDHSVSVNNEKINITTKEYEPIAVGWLFLCEYSFVRCRWLKVSVRLNRSRLRRVRSLQANQPIRNHIRQCVR